jgi:hypothetical protein
MALSESNRQAPVQFIEMSGKTLLRVLTEHEPSPNDLARVGLTDESILRVNRQGDVEIRRMDRWEVIGGLLGDFEDRVRKETGLHWA